MRSGAYNRPMNEKPLVGVVMGSKSDYEVLSEAVDLLRALDIPYDAKVVSAHRTPDWLFKYAETARDRGLRVIIAARVTANFRNQKLTARLATASAASFIASLKVGWA